MSQKLLEIAKELLDDKTSSTQVAPQFAQEQAFTYFSKVYQANPRSYTKPDWLPAPAVPKIKFENKEIRPAEVQVAINHSKSNSAPSPFDQVSYQIPEMSFPVKHFA